MISKKSTDMNNAVPVMMKALSDISRGCDLIAYSLPQKLQTILADAGKQAWGSIHNVFRKAPRDLISAIQNTRSTTPEITALQSQINEVSVRLFNYYDPIRRGCTPSTEAEIALLEILNDRHYTTFSRLAVMSFCLHFVSLQGYDERHGGLVTRGSIGNELGAGLDKPKWLGLSNGEKTLQNRRLPAEQAA